MSGEKLVLIKKLRSEKSRWGSSFICRALLQRFTF